MAVQNVESFLQDVIHECNIGDVPDFISIINQKCRELSKKRRWRHYITLDTITVLAAYSTGTVSMTEGSGTVTGSGTTFTSAMVGRTFRAANGQGIYTITAYASATSITISPVWPHDSVSDETFQIYDDTYDFPANFQSLLEAKDAVTERPLDPIEWVDALRRWESFVYTDQSAIPPGFAWPWEYTQFMFNTTTSRWQITVNAVSSADRMLDIIYRRWPTAVTKITDTPDIPEYLEETLRLHLFMHFTRRRSCNNEVEFMDRKQRLAEWELLAENALYSAKVQDSMLVIPLQRNKRVLL